MTSKFRMHLYNILESLNNLEDSNKTLMMCVEDRLTNSLEQYRRAMKDMYNYVLSRSNVKVLKALAKLNQKGEIKDDSESN